MLLFKKNAKVIWFYVNDVVSMRIPLETFFIQKGSGQRLQLQIREQIIMGINQGRLRAGDKLPSSRHLSQYLQLGRATVSLAYADLVAQRVIETKDRSGYFITSEIEAVSTRPLAPKPISTPKRFDWTGHLDARFAYAQRKDRVVNWHQYRYPFTYGQPDRNLIERAGWREAALRSLSPQEFDTTILDYYGGDDPKLIDYIIRNVLSRRGIHAKPEQILLTLGAQNGLWMVSEILLGQGGACAFEDPGYPGLREILYAKTKAAHPIAIDRYGMVPEALPVGIKAAFVTGSHQCPTNAIMPMARRHALLQHANTHNFAVVEDDYEFPMSQSGASLPALKAMDQSGCVIYVGSFSKAVFPGVRIGYIVAEPGFIEEARALRAMSLRHPPGQMQRTLASFMAMGFFDQQLKRIRASYAQRRDIMMQAIYDHRLELVDTAQDGGSCFWMRLPNGVDALQLSEVLKARDVLIEPGPAFFANPLQGSQFYRLAYSSVSHELINEGISRIAQVISSLRLQR